MTLPVKNMQNETGNLQEQMTRAFALLRDEHPVVELFLSFYSNGRPIDEFDIFSTSSFSNYFNQHGPLLKEILAEEDMDHFKKQLKYYKALVLIMGVLAEDPLIMDNKESKELKKVTQLCLENTAELRDILLKAIEEKTSLRNLRKGQARY